MKIGIWMFFALLAPTIFAEELCDGGLVGNTASELAYKMRGDRCEGIYKLEVNSEQIRLVSLFERFEAWNPGEASLVIEWELPALAAETFHLRAISLPQRSAYRMDTRVPPRLKRFEWPLEIVESLGYDREQLGVVGWFRVRGWSEGLYFPIRLSNPIGPSPRSGTYTLLFVPELKLQEVYVSLVEVGPDGRAVQALFEGRPLEYGYYPAKTPLDLEISNLPHTGVYRVTLKAVAPSLPPMTYSLLFYHEGLSS